MHNSDLDRQVEKWKNIKLDSPFEKYPAWVIEKIKKYALNRGHATKESLLFIQSKKGVPLDDLKIILDNEIKQTRKCAKNKTKIE